MTIHLRDYLQPNEILESDFQQLSPEEQTFVKLQKAVVEINTLRSRKDPFWQLDLHWSGMDLQIEREAIVHASTWASLKHELGKPIKQYKKQYGPQKHGQARWK